MRTAALLAVLSSVAFGQSNRTACSIGPDVENDYRTLPSMSDLSRSWEERYAPRRALAKKYLTDWPLQFTLQEPILYHFDMGREWDLAIENYRALPDRSFGELLEARLLSPMQRKKSREALDRILRLAKDSPWAHLAMLEWAADTRNGDRALAEKEFETFRRMCPGDRFVFRHLKVPVSRAIVRLQPGDEALVVRRTYRVQDVEVKQGQTQFTDEGWEIGLLQRVE